MASGSSPGVHRLYRAPSPTDAEQASLLHAPTHAIFPLRKWIRRFETAGERKGQGGDCALKACLRVDQI